MSDLINGVPIEQVHETEKLVDERAKIVNPLTGREVYDTPENEAARANWRRKIADGRNEAENEMRRAIHNRNMGKLNLLGTKQVAEHFGYSQATARQQMKNDIIPSFHIGTRLFTQAWIIEKVEKQAQEAQSKNFNKRSYPRLAFKYDNGLEW